MGLDLHVTGHRPGGGNLKRGEFKMATKKPKKTTKRLKKVKKLEATKPLKRIRA